MLVRIILVTGLNLLWLVLLDAASSLHYMLPAKVFWQILGGCLTPNVGDNLLPTHHAGAGRG